MATNEPLWWQRGIIYQIYPRSFQDSTGDGIGDLTGIEQRLPYLSEVLGVDAIWLSPIYPSPMADFGYDVSNYVDIHPIFGTLEDFDRLVAEAHRREIRVLIDFVPNHSSDQHPWFQESRSSRDNPKRDWYVWADPKPDGSPPNNWLGFFGGRAWEWDEATGQYYLHSFLKEQPDLNWRNPEVKKAMLDVLRFWLDRGVDGFRIDVAHLIMKDPEMRDNPPNPHMRLAPDDPRHDWDAQLSVYNKAHTDIHQTFREIRSVLDEYSREWPRMAVGEIHEFDWPVWVGYYGAKLDELHMPFNFALIFSDWRADVVRTIVDSVEAALPFGAWPNYVLGNHDVHRVVSRVGPQQARVAMMLLLTLRGTPTLYYGDEIGMHDVEITPEQVQDPFEKNIPGIGLGRDPERTPMQWSPEPNAGFCSPDVQPWLPIADDYEQINVAAERNDPRSMLSLTRALIRLRQDTPALHSGTYQPVSTAPAECMAFIRELDSTRMLVAVNFSDSEQTFPVDRSGTIHLSTELDRGGSVGPGELKLRPYEACIVQLADHQ